MHYTLHQLEIFLKIVEHQSITKAAEELYLTQPAVSIQLKNFQQHFDIPLTEVVARQLYITEFGNEIACAAQNIIDEATKMHSKTLAYQGKLTGKLKISVVSTGKYVIPYFLADFLKMHSGIELQMDVTNKARVVESLEKNLVDFSLVSVLPTQLQTENIALMQNKLYLVGNRSRLFPRKKYDIKIFEELPLIYREQGSGTRYVMEKFIEKNKIPVRMQMELATNEAVKQAVIAGIGYSIMPLIGIKNELIHGDLQVIPVRKFPIKSMWHLVWLRGKRFSPVAEAYLEFVKSKKQLIIQEKFEWFESF